MTLKSLENGFLKRIRAVKNKLDKRVKKALDKNNPKYKEPKDRLIHFREYIYMPKDNTLWENIIQEHYDSILVRHSDQYKIQELITQNYI